MEKNSRSQKKPKDPRKPRNVIRRVFADNYEDKIHRPHASRQVGGLATLQPFLEELFERYHSPHWLESDPIQFAHRFKDPKDQEIVAFLSACFAYGKVALIQRAVSVILAPMGERPAQFILDFDGTNLWKGFRYRFHRAEHVVILTKLLKEILHEFGSLSDMFRVQSASAVGETACERGLNGAVLWLRERAQREVEKMGDPGLSRGMRFLFNAPVDGSACKRMVMFLRWMVRKDSVDLGLWTWMHPRELIMPADTHVARISYYLGFREGGEGKAPNWKMAQEITASLRKLNLDDPVRYDFALARLGILDICKRQYAKSVCELCPVSPGCRFSALEKLRLLRDRCPS